MTKKVLKEQQQETREIVKQIFTLALAINSNCTQREATGEKPTVFVGFSGHIAGVHVEIYGKNRTPKKKNANSYQRRRLRLPSSKKSPISGVLIMVIFAAALHVHLLARTLTLIYIVNGAARR